jgi:inner membrane protein
MPSPIAHSITGYIISKAFLRNNCTAQDNRNLGIIFYSIFIANVPDFDFIPQLFTDDKYHHGITHGFFFAVGFSVVAALIFCRMLNYSYNRFFIITLLIYNSHLILDFITDGGKGIKLLWPFFDYYYISPISLFPAVRHSQGLFHVSHLKFIGFEVSYSIILLSIIWLWEKRRKNY